MSVTSFIGSHPILIGIILVGGGLTWKFIIQPIMNEGNPIEPTEDDLKPLEEKMGLTDLMDGFDIESEL